MGSDLDDVKGVTISSTVQQFNVWTLWSSLDQEPVRLSRVLCDSVTQMMV
jgi:hypothetical protein